jgi:putative ABC transport system permease protein
MIGSAQEAVASLPSPSRVLPGDLTRAGLAGLRARPLRAALSALGIAIGIAAMVAVLGISTVSRAGLLAQIHRLGTNLLTAAPARRSSARTPSCRPNRWR